MRPGPTVSGSWPRGLLAILFGAAVALHVTTFSNLELALQRQFETSRGRGGDLADVGRSAESSGC